MKFELSKINNNLTGFQQFITLYESSKDVKFDKITIVLPDFFVANMSAVFGAVLYKLAENINEIELVSLSQRVQIILQKNKFLTEFGFQSVNDSNHTTIPYRKFKRTEATDFTNYIINEFINRSEIPKCSTKLRYEILQGICEMFVNASMHTLSPYIFVCGQFFPKQELIDITIVDIGDGIKNTINSIKGTSFSANQAIKWALTNGNTTKNIPGGLGMSLLTELINLNEGSLQIISNDGFYELKKRNEYYRDLTGEFPGTIINIQLKTNDPHRYSLKGEN